MLTYNLENRGKLSLYEYLYECIKKDIIAGKIKADEKLPSKRELSQHLNISVITVQNAYEQLIAEGYIYAVEKRGYFVNKINMLNISGERNKTDNTGNDNKYRDLQSGSEREYFADFKTNSISYDKFPFSVWSKIMRNILSEHEKAFVQNLPSMGLVELRKAIADNLYRFRGMNVSYEQIIIGAGTEYLYSIIIRLLRRDSVVAVEDPGHKKISQIYTSQGVECRYIPLDKYGMDIESLKKSGANAAHVSPSHQFPTGIVMPVKRRYRLLEWADGEENRYIIEDDYDSEFRFTGRPIPTMQSIDFNGKVIYVNTFSKTLMPSIRIAYMVLPLRLAAAYNDKIGFYSCTVSGFEQMALARFISEAYYERHINRMRNYYRGYRNTIISAIKNSDLGKHAEIKEENAGLHFILKVNTDMEDDEFVKKAGDNGINIACVSQYCTQTAERYRHMLLINYSNADEAQIKEAISILDKIVNDRYI